MRYMMMIYSRETAEGIPPDEIPALVAAHQSVMTDSEQRGVLVGYAGLKPTHTATTVRVAYGKPDSKPLVTDGPFAETKEQLAGYYIIECANLDEAIAWAARIPSGCKGAPGCIEVRPIADIPPMR